MKAFRLVIATCLSLSVSWASGYTVNLPSLRQNTGVSLTASASTTTSVVAFSKGDMDGVSNQWPIPPGSADTLAYTAASANSKVTGAESKAAVTVGSQCICASGASTAGPLVNLFGTSKTSYDQSDYFGSCTALAIGAATGDAAFTIQAHPTTPTRGSALGEQVTLVGHFVLYVYGAGNSDDRSRITNRDIEVSLNDSELFCSAFGDAGWQVSGELTRTTKLAPNATPMNVSVTYPVGMNVTYDFSEATTIGSGIDIAMETGITNRSDFAFPVTDLVSSSEVLYSILTYCTVEDESFP